MSLQELQDRKELLETKIAQVTSQVYTLHGQKSEVEYQIDLELKKIANGKTAALATPDVLPVE